MSNGSFDGFAAIVKLLAKKGQEEEYVTDAIERLNDLKELQGKIQAAVAYVKDIRTTFAAQSKATSSEVKRLESELKGAVGAELFTQLMTVAESGASTAKVERLLSKKQEDVLYSDLYKAIESAPSKEEQAELTAEEEQDENTEQSDNEEVEEITTQEVVNEPEVSPWAETKEEVLYRTGDETPFHISEQVDIEREEPVSHEETVVHVEPEVQAPVVNTITPALETTEEEVLSNDASDESEVEFEDDNVSKETNTETDTIRPVRPPRFRRNPRTIS